MRVAHKDDYIIKKNIKKDEKRGTVTLQVSFRSAEYPRGKNIKTYTNADAVRWLEEGGIIVGEVLHGCKTSNYVGGQPAGTLPEGTWVFTVPPTEAVRTTRAKKPKIKVEEVDTTTDLSAEFDGLNYDGVTAVVEPAETKTTTKRKRKPRK